jgi:hypothetical protein
MVPERDWVVVDARTLRDETLAWICPHEAASMWLMALRESSLARRDVVTATMAIDLHLVLPISDRERRRLARLQADLRAVPATLAKGTEQHDHETDPAAHA